MICLLTVSQIKMLKHVHTETQKEGMKIKSMNEGEAKGHTCTDNDGLF